MPRRRPIRRPKLPSPFPLPVLFTAWTWHDGAGIAGEVARRAKLGGFKTVAVELSEDTGGDPGATLDAQDVKYLKDAGLTVVGWGPVDGNTARQLSELGVDGWLPQVETPTQREALLYALNTAVGRGMPKALVTTYGGLDTTADVSKLKMSWGGEPFTFVECYKADGFPHEQIDRMLGQGVVYGFDRAALRALVGTYRGEMPAEYPGLDAADYGGIYLGENTSDDQLRAFAALVPTPPPEEPTVPNDAPERNAKISLIAEEWLKEFGPAPRSRLANILTIAETTDDEWNAVRDDVVAALKGDVADIRAANTRLIAANADLQRRIANAKTALG